MRAALDDLAAGEPRLLLIEGPAGIGKTRLLTEARRLAADRGRSGVLTARGSQLEKAFGFGAVRQLFEPALGSRRAAGRSCSPARRAAPGPSSTSRPASRPTGRSPSCTGCTGWR